MSPLEPFRGSTEPTKTGGVQSATPTDGLHGQLTRRNLLGGIGTSVGISLAGCMAGGCTTWTTVSFDPVDAAAIAAEQTTDVDRAPAMVTALADRVLAGEEPTVETLRGGPLERVTYVEHDGGFYEITEETIAEGRVSGPTYELSRDREMDVEALSDDAITFADLPRHDQWRVGETSRYAISADGIPGYYSAVSFVAGYIDEADQEASVLAAGIDASAIEAGGDVVKIEHVGEGSADAWRYRYTATRIADDVDAFADHVLDRHGSTAFDPSDEGRRLLSETQEAGGSLDICERDGDEETVERRAAADELEREVDSLTPPVVPDDEEPPRVRYVRYEGQWYRIGFSQSTV